MDNGTAAICLKVQQMALVNVVGCLKPDQQREWQRVVWVLGDVARAGR